MKTCQIRKLLLEGFPARPLDDAPEWILRAVPTNPAPWPRHVFPRPTYRCGPPESHVTFNPAFDWLRRFVASTALHHNAKGSIAIHALQCSCFQLEVYFSGTFKHQGVSFYVRFYLKIIFSFVISFSRIRQTTLRVNWSRIALFAFF